MLPTGARLTRPSKWHVTLVFLGDVLDPGGVEEVLDGVAPPPPFSLRLAGGGRFGSAAWAGVEGDLLALGSLRSSVRDSLTAGGFPSDDRPYQPHLTVSYRGDRAVAAALAGYASEDWPVAEFSLVKSEGGEYARLRDWSLTRSRPAARPARSRTTD